METTEITTEQQNALIQSIGQAKFDEIMKPKTKTGDDRTREEFDFHLNLLEKKLSELSGHVKYLRETFMN